MVTETVAIVELQQKFEQLRPKGELARLQIIVKELDIQTKPELDAGNEILGELKQQRKIVEDFWEPLRASAYDSYDRIQKQKKFFLAPFEKLIEALNTKMGAYVLAVKRREQEEADRQAQEAEASRKALEAEAQRLLKRGEIEKAQQVMEVAEMPPPEIPTADLALEGTTVREPWKARVTDLKALAAAVGAGLVPLQAIEANLSFLNTQAKSFAKELNYPGVEAYQTVQFAHRR